MSFLQHLFHRNTKRAESVAFIDIAADSVGGAYARYTESETPEIIYTRRLPIEIRKDEPHESAMIRALKALGDELIREGAPALMRATGSGTANTILVSVDTPWQETKVRTEHFERANPFVFTKSIVASAMEKTSVVPKGKLLADESIIGTILNGYETHDPYGKKVHRASIVILTSFIDEPIAEGIAATLRGIYHTKNILLIVGSSLRYQAMRAVFPHEHEALILDATGSLTSIALVRKGLFVALAEVPPAIGDSPWVHTVTNEIAELAKQYPLPRTIFLLARESEISSFREKLDAANLGELWLSDNPPKIVSVLASHIVGSVRQTTSAPPDLQLLLMTLFWQHRPSE